MKQQQTTLAHLYRQAKKNMPNKVIEQINRRLLLLFHLSQLQLNICSEIKELFKKYSSYRFSVKHNHEKIKNLIKGDNEGTAEFFRSLSGDATDNVCDDADALEKMIFEWAKVIGIDKIMEAVKNVEQKI